MHTSPSLGHITTDNNNRSTPTGIEDSPPAPDSVIATKPDTGALPTEHKDADQKDDDDLPSRRQDIDILARTIWGEARGESIRGMEAIAMVVMNRMRLSARWVLQGKKTWWGGTIREICLKSYQFSCWNPSDPNRQKLNSIGVDNKAFIICHRIARRAVNGVLEDILDGSTHYHAKSITPHWSLGKSPCCIIGNHLFYNTID